MAGCNCTKELNKQIQGLATRLSQAEDNITNQFYATSLAIQGLAANPLTTGSVASVTAILNGSPVGFNLMQMLKSKLPTVDFKKLMMGMASGLMNKISAEIGAVLDGLVDQIKGMISQVENMIGSLEAQIAGMAASIADAAANLEAAIESGVQGAIDSAQAAVDSLNAEVQGIQDQISKLSDMKNDLLNSMENVDGFLQGQIDIGNCKTTSMNYHL